MRILLTGGRGMLGSTLAKMLSGKVLSADLPECDIRQPESLRKVMREFKPEAVIHCAAMTNVDGCEAEPETAEQVNVTGSGNVAKLCTEFNARLVAISTDYVFAGNAERPYSEADIAIPATVYGRTKLGGEQQIAKFCPNSVILRTAWLYGFGGPSFVHTMLKLGRSGKLLKVVNDQIGNPTSTLVVARGVAAMLTRPELTGIFHLSCEGEASWYEFAAEIFRLKRLSVDLQPCTTAEFPRPAPRPANSRLEKANWRKFELPPLALWQDALAEFLALEEDL